MKTIRFFFFAAAMFAFSDCSTSRGTGALIGGGAGAAAGGAIGGGTGAVIGGAAGTVGGAVIGNQRDKKKAERRAGRRNRRR